MKTAVLAALAFAVATPARADVMPMLDLELMHQADVVTVGSVLSTEQIGELTFRRAAIERDDVLKGRLDEKRISFRFRPILEELPGVRLHEVAGAPGLSSS